MSATNHSKAIFLASFLTIFAAGVGFAVRGAILNDWEDQFGFTKFELGKITGGGLTGFGIVIILSSLFLDKIGYKPILMLACVLHVLSAVITLAATPIHEASGRNGTYWCLWLGTFLFAIANGLCEAAVNPLVATLYPKQKTHYLNILHASWPAGLIAGGMLAYCFSGFLGEQPLITKLRWEIPMAAFIIPAAMYGAMLFNKKLPESEASAAGISLGEMLSQFASPLLITLLVLHAMVGYVELGTDSWITNILGNVIKGQAILVFVYTSAMMFVLRFFAGPIVERINPIGLLAISGVVGFIGLTMLSKAETAGMAFVAASVYGLGKTFLWPTMLGVVGERFPRGGAIVMGTIGGIGMLSAGEIGSPGIGYKQDYFASQQLKQSSPDTFQRYKAEKENHFLFFPPITGLDGEKVAALGDGGAKLERAVDLVNKDNRQGDVADTTRALGKWWDTAKVDANADKEQVESAKIFGGRQALRLTAYVPAVMAVLYFLLVLYFRATGGYKQVEIHHQGEGAMSEL